jgi:large subunit ribosomal protein L15
VLSPIVEKVWNDRSKKSIDNLCIHFGDLVQVRSCKAHLNRKEDERIRRRWPFPVAYKQPRNAVVGRSRRWGPHPARRSDMKLNELRDNEGATKRRMRVGRGPGSGKGKTAGRGIKGQKSRSGVAIKGYEGGQMPLYQRLPKRGFNKPNRKQFAVVNLGIIQKFIDAKKLDAKKDITEDTLLEAGVIRRKLDGVRVLAKGEFSTKVKLAVTGASKSAIEAVEKAGGSLAVTSAPAAE